MAGSLHGRIAAWRAERYRCNMPHDALHIKSGTPVVEEGWKAERAGSSASVFLFSLSAFGSGSGPTLCAKPPHASSLPRGHERIEVPFHPRDGSDFHSLY